MGQPLLRIRGMYVILIAYIGFARCTNCLLHIWSKMRALWSNTRKYWMNVVIVNYVKIVNYVNYFILLLGKLHNIAYEHGIDSYKGFHQPWLRICKDGIDAYEETPLPARIQFYTDDIDMYQRTLATYIICIKRSNSRCTRRNCH